MVIVKYLCIQMQGHWTIKLGLGVYQKSILRGMKHVPINIKPSFNTLPVLCVWVSIVVIESDVEMFSILGNCVTGKALNDNGCPLYITSEKNRAWYVNLSHMITQGQNNSTIRTKI